MRLFLLATCLAAILSLAHGYTPTNSDPQQSPRGTSERCGAGADVLPDIAAMVPCWKGAVNAKGDTIDDGRSWLFATYKYTYSNAPAPALNYYGYWIPTPNSGLKGENGCIFYEYASDMQVASRWQPTCPNPKLAWWAVFAIVMMGIGLLPCLVFLYSICGGSFSGSFRRW
ncbi:hypothetical protein BC828DRAFT_409938 [Blastocladiella britannica]|nr:hypothetical protein BC828DRAFT_409938 [Blastocladiella britannica]